MNIIKKKNILKHFKGISPRQLFIIAFFVITVLGASFFSVYSQSGGGLGGSSLSKGLIAHWTLDADDYNSTTFRVSDNTPYENHGTNSGATPTTDRHGKVGGAMSFNGLSNRVLISYPNPVSQTSVVAWFKRSGIPAGNHHIITGGANVEISIPDSGQIRTGVTTNTQGRRVFNSGAGLSDGNWHQVAMTYDGVNLRSFIDGQITATNPVSGNLVGTATEIGRYLSDAYAANGSIDDVRIYNRALSEQEISLLYDSYEPKTQISSINSGLVGHWTLSEEDYNTSNNRVTDKTPYENHGTNFGAMPTTDRHDKTGGAMDFGLRTNNYYLNIGNDTSLQVTGDQTIAMWLKPVNVAEGRQNPYNKAYGGEGTITQETNGSLNYYWGTGGGNTTPYQGFGMASTIQNNIWSHIAIVRNLNTMKLRWYKNGIFVNETNASYSSATASAISASIGTGYAGAYSGSIDDVRIYNRALSDSEISLLYNSYTPQTGGDSLQKGLVLDMPLTSEYTKTEIVGSQIMTDRTPYGNDGQNVGAVIGSNYSTLNGTTYITIPDSDSIHNKAFGISNNFTISTWAHPLSWANWATIINQANGGSWSNTLNGLWASDSPTGFRCVMGSGIGGNPAGSSIGPAYNPGLNNWHHVVCIADGTNLKIYVNGIYRGQSAISSLTYPRTELFEPITIGRRSTGTGPSFNGYISNIKVYDRAISEDEVKSLYTQGAAMIGGIPNQE